MALAQDYMQEIYDAVRQPLLILDSGLRVRSANASFYEAFDVLRNETEGWLLYELGNGQWDIPGLPQHLATILPTHGALEDFEVEHDFLGLGRRTMLLQARRLGEAEMILLAIEDITERKQWEHHQRLLLAELGHRIKNTLANVQSIAVQTLRTSTSLDSFEQDFLGRLRAFSVAVDLLIRDNWRSVNLSEILRQSLRAFETAPPRIRLSGEDLRVEARAALALSTVGYELASNAAKYGALSNPKGDVEVTWDLTRTDLGPTVWLSWREAGGPMVQPPASQGFGLTLIKQYVQYELDGEAKLEFLPEGLRCEFLIPYRPGNFPT